VSQLLIMGLWIRVFVWGVSLMRIGRSECLIKRMSSSCGLSQVELRLVVACCHKLHTRSSWLPFGHSYVTASSSAQRSHQSPMVSM